MKFYDWWLGRETKDTGEDEGWADPDSEPLEDLKAWVSLFARTVGSSVSGPFTHTFTPTLVPGAMMTVVSAGKEMKYRVTRFDLSGTYATVMLVDELVPLVGPENHLTWHEDRAFPSPRSGGCGGFPSQPLVVVPTPVLPSVTTPGRSRSGLITTLKSRYKPP